MFQRRVMTIGSSSLCLLCEWRRLIYFLPLIFLVPIIRNWPGCGCCIHTCRFSPFPRPAHLTYFATSWLSFVFHLLLMVEVRLFSLFRPLGIWSLINHSAAAPYGTVKFTSPLYRKNLHYKVVSKPSSAAQVVRDMVRYILGNHRDETGIIYCLSRAVSNGFPNLGAPAVNVRFLVV